MRRALPGVEVRGLKLRIWFIYQGQRCRETLESGGGQISKGDRDRAGLIRAKIDAEIATGVFDYRKWFPNSSRFKKESELQLDLQSPENSELDFNGIAFDWLKTCTSLARGTRVKYEQGARFWSKHLNCVPLVLLDHAALKRSIELIPWSSSKTRNNQLSILKRILEWAVDIGHLHANPALRIKQASVQKKMPSPLKPDEVEAVLAWMEKEYPMTIRNYFETAFFSGMRPQELIALSWDHVDFDFEQITVAQAMTAGEIKSTKTNKVRYVQMNSRSFAALHRQKEHSKGTNSEFVFLNPGTNRPWSSEKFQRELYWKPSLRACGISARAAYQTRHTFASMSLTAGANPVWIAAQLGHSSTQMLFQVYGKWISTAASKEHLKIESMFSKS